MSPKLKLYEVLKPLFYLNLAYGIPLIPLKSWWKIYLVNGVCCFHVSITVYSIFYNIIRAELGTDDIQKIVFRIQAKKLAPAIEELSNLLSRLDGMEHAFLRRLRNRMAFTLITPIVSPVLILLRKLEHLDAIQDYFVMSVKQWGSDLIIITLGISFVCFSFFFRHVAQLKLPQSIRCMSLHREGCRLLKVIQNECSLLILEWTLMCVSAQLIHARVLVVQPRNSISLPTLAIIITIYIFLSFAVMGISAVNNNMEQCLPHLLEMGKEATEDESIRNALLFSENSRNLAMSHGGPSYGLSAQIGAKIAGKRDPDGEREVLEWIEAVIGERLPNLPYEEVLRDGQVLCKLMNQLLPGSVNKINTGGGQFKLMENITKFQEGCKRYGVPEIDVFQTVDLYEKRNIPQVTQCLFALGRTCQIHPEWRGPILGPKLSDENKRQFSEEQLRAGEGVINLQYGTNKGANQSGINFGNTRHM